MAACDRTPEAQARLDSQVIVQWDKGSPRWNPNLLKIPLVVPGVRGLSRQVSASTPVRTSQEQLHSPQVNCFIAQPHLLALAVGNGPRVGGASSQSIYVCPAGLLAAAIPASNALGSEVSL